GLRRRAHHGDEHRALDGGPVRRGAHLAGRVLAAAQPPGHGAGEGGGSDREPRGGRRSVRHGRDRAYGGRGGGRPALIGALHGGRAATPGGCHPHGGRRSRGHGHGDLGLDGGDERVHRGDVGHLPGP